MHGGHGTSRTTLKCHQRPWNGTCGHQICLTSQLGASGTEKIVCNDDKLQRNVRKDVNYRNSICNSVHQIHGAPESTERPQRRQSTNFYIGMVLSLGIHEQTQLERLQRRKTTACIAPYCTYGHGTSMKTLNYGIMTRYDTVGIFFLGLDPHKP